MAGMVGIECRDCSLRYSRLTRPYVAIRHGSSEAKTLEHVKRL